MENVSPFPGMDPYTERREWWKGLHNQIVAELGTHLLPPLLAPAYFVDPEPSLQVLTERTVYPDLQINAKEIFPSKYPSGMGLPVAQPTMTMTFDVENATDDDNEEMALWVRDASERLVTVIEVLSYSNKAPGEAKRILYLAKRRELIASGVHLVEVDLLRWGRRAVLDLPEQPYHILVTRAEEHSKTRIWSFGFDTAIPTVPLPLIDADEYVPLPLQEAFQVIYQARIFRERIDYGVDPEGPLTNHWRAAIREWLNQSEQ